MATARTVVLDSSAVLAYVLDEAGAAPVEELIGAGATIGQISWCEVLSKLAEHGRDIDEDIATLERAGILGGGLLVQPLDDAQIRLIARLRPATRPFGLSLGDRACLALARQLGTPAVTADRAWAGAGDAVGVEIQIVR